MRLNLFNQVTPVFRGRREDKNTVQQLKQDNNYSLTENNQIRINKAIDNLANEKGEKNVKFLLDVADGLQYGTNIDLGKEAKNNWKERLHEAASKSLSMSDSITQQKYTPELTRVFSTPKGLSNDEKDILKSRESILSRLDMKQLENEKNPNIKNVQSNLDYFIASSETPIKQKKYILNRLDFFLSPDYKINPQLKDKKTQAAAEMINDIVVDTKESKIPNTKAINQKHHGMCAAISIARKLASYEYKPQYVDSVMSELDDSDSIMVYDKTRLGQGVKVPVEKVAVDFDDADNKGYRIVDASTTHWMHIADSYNGKNESLYIPFDAENFDASRDNHFMNPINNPDYANKHRYYQSLLLAKDTIGNVKASKLRKDIKYADNSRSKDNDIEYLQKTNNLIKTNIKEVIPTLSNKELHNTLTKVMSLQSEYSSDIDNVKDGTKKYHFIPNEEDIMKERKIKAFLKDTFQDRVDDKKLDENVSNIRELTEESLDIQTKLNPSSSQSKNVSRARSLYEAAASYRNANLTALNDKDYKTDKMIKYNIPDEETIVLDTIDKTMKHIEKTGDKRYINHFSAIYGTKPTEKDTLDLLKVAHQSVEGSVTIYLDMAYKMLGMGNRKEALKADVKNMKSLMEAGENELVNSASFSLGLKETNKAKVLKEYDRFEKVLSGNPTEKQYNEVFNKLGYKSQMHAFADAYNVVNDAINDSKNPENKEIIKNFNEANGIEGDEVTPQSKDILQKIGMQFNQISENYSFIHDSLDIADEQGNIINSAQSYNKVIEAMESKGDIVSGKEMKQLKNHIDSIDKLRSQDEFSKKQGKISDPTLYKFSKAEKATLKRIDKSINKMYSETNKELSFVLSDIRQPLEEHVRKNGMEKGSFWNTQTGSGLQTEQEVKILEMMTDKRYRATDNIEKAVDKIKNTEHSGVTGTSVFHNRVGGHAQYVVEISPVNGKDVLFHDNSWGARENENTWVDSENVRHTDYSDIRGGETGYITNDKYRNGNYIEDFMYKPGHISPKHIENKQLRKLSGSGSDYKFQMLFDTLIPGNDGDMKDLAIKMKYNIFQPDTQYIQDLKSYASEMTQAEINAFVTRHQTAGENYKNVMNSIDKRIETTQFHKGIDSEEDYNALSDTDSVKVTFEKAALLRSYPDAADWKKLADVKDVKDINELKKVRNEKARDYFDYAFAKDPMVLYYYATNPKINKVMDILNGAIDNHNIKLNDKQKIEIISNIAMYNKKEDKQFDGSLKHTIGFMVNKTLNQFDKVVPDSDDAKLAKQEIKENLTNSLSDALYFNESDIDNKSTKFSAIAKYIDKKYNPETNEDFVNIYRNLQDMTTEEFKKETADVKDEDLAIKDYSGYEMLRRYKAAEPKADTLVRNSVYQQELLKDITLSETTPVYKYNKLYKKNNGAIYNNGRTFDDLYRDMSSSLISLDYEKMFNKYKDANLRNYNAMPSYPKLNPIGEKTFNKQRDMIEDIVLSRTSDIKNKKAILKTIGLLDDLCSTVANLPEHDSVSKKQAKYINTLAVRFLSDSMLDPSMKQSTDSALKLITPNNIIIPGSYYKSAAKGLMAQYDDFVKNDAVNNLKQGITQDKYILIKSMENVIDTNIDKKYQTKLREDLNNWIKEESKPVTFEFDFDDKVANISNNLDRVALPKKNFNLTKAAYIDNLVKSTKALVDTKVLIEGSDEENNKPCLIDNNKLDKQYDEINNLTLSFVSGNIMPEHQEHAYRMLTGFVDKAMDSTTNIYNQDKAYDASNKFFDDFKKHSVLSNPQELLKDYLLLNAKDSPIHSKDTDEATRAVRNLEGKEITLNSAFQIASLIEMQEYLMEAVSSGNAEQVVDEFKNIEVPLIDPVTNTKVNMDNYKAVDFIAKNLMTNEEDSTAVMFINKLGLAEKFIKAQNEITDFDAAKKEVRKTVNILGTTSRQSDIVDKEMTKFKNDEDFEKCDDYVEKIDNAKLNIINKTKNMNRKNAVKVYLNALDGVKTFIAENPGVPRLLFVEQAITAANEKVGEMANQDLRKLQGGISRLNSMYNLINKLDIPEYSPAIQEREKFNAKYEDFQTYNNTLLINQSKKSSSSMKIKTIED